MELKIALEESDKGQVWGPGFLLRAVGLPNAKPQSQTDFSLSQAPLSYHCLNVAHSLQKAKEELDFACPVCPSKSTRRMC